MPENVKATAESLLPDVKNDQSITWDDPEGEKKLLDSIRRGMQYINDIGGAEYDYAIPDDPRTLLFTYCRYDRANALDDFRKSYLPELLGLQWKTELRGMEVADDQSQ